MSKIVVQQGINNGGILAEIPQGVLDDLAVFLDDTEGFFHSIATSDRLPALGTYINLEIISRGSFRYLMFSKQWQTRSFRI